MKKRNWKMNDISNAKYLGIIEFQDNDGEYHNFEVVETDNRLVFGGMTNTGLAESGYIEKDGASTDETLQELVADLEVYYNDGKEYTSMIVVNDRMAKGGKADGGGVGEIKVGDKVTLPEIKMRNGEVQFEKVENGDVINIENGLYDVLDPKTKRIHRVSLDQIKYANGGGVGEDRTVLSEDEKQFIREESQESGQGYSYRAKVLFGEDIVLKEKDRRPIKKWAFDNYEIAKKIAERLNKVNKFSNGGGVGDDSARIYVADLAAYNDGRLVGEWLDLSDYSSGSEVMDAIQELLDKWSEESGETREEYAIHDIDNFPSGIYHESMGENDFDEFYELYNVAEEVGVPYQVIADWVSEGHDASSFQDAYQGQYDNFEDFAYQLVEDIGLESFSSPESYIYITDTDRRIMAGEEADSRIGDMDDDDIIRDADLESEYEEAVESENEEEQESILTKAKQKLEEDIYNEWYDGLDNPIDFLVEEQGMYSVEDLMKANFVSIDYEKLGRDLSYDYTTIDHGGSVYVLNSNYAKGGKLSSSVGKSDGGTFGNPFLKAIFGR